MTTFWHSICIRGVSDPRYLKMQTSWIGVCGSGRHGNSKLPAVNSADSSTCGNRCGSLSGKAPLGGSIQWLRRWRGMKRCRSFALPEPSCKMHFDHQSSRRVSMSPALSRSAILNSACACLKYESSGTPNQFNYACLTPRRQAWRFSTFRIARRTSYRNVICPLSTIYQSCAEL